MDNALDATAAFFRWTELDQATWPDLRDRVLRAEQEGTVSEPRSYPGYPCWPLERVRPRRLCSLDRALLCRRSARVLCPHLPTRRVLSRLLHLSHGVHEGDHRGPVPSAGGLQALELYLVNFAPDWLPAGTYHYDRQSHTLAQLRAGADRDDWRNRVPSLGQVASGSLLWLLVGDGERVTRKYGARGYRFLLLEAGHLMQNLCVLSASLGLATVPLGGFLERETARALMLPATDEVLYAGIVGEPASRGRQPPEGSRAGVTVAVPPGADAPGSPGGVFTSPRPSAP